MITGCKVQDILEAAHIHAYSDGGSFDITNGLLLRADIHTLFDLGLIAINTIDMSVIITSNLRATEYQELEGRKLSPSVEETIFPDKKALDDHRFRAQL